MSLIFSHQACFRFCIRFCFFKLSKRDFSVWQVLEVSNAQRLSHSTNLWKDPPSKYSWSYFVLLSLAKYLPTPNLSGHFARHSFHNLPCSIFIFFISFDFFFLSSFSLLSILSNIHHLCISPPGRLSCSDRLFGKDQSFFVFGRDRAPIK